jgi:hypothetical protein
MRNYCKAYKVKNLRLFAAWEEKRDEHVPVLTDDDIVYLWDDYSVVSSPVQDRGTVFEAVTPEWQVFCHDMLDFSVPAGAQANYAKEHSDE